MTPVSEATKSTSRARIGRLEDSVSGIWKAVQKIEAKLGCDPSVPDHAGPFESHSPGAADDDAGSDDESDSTDQNQEGMSTHLLQLFQNGVLVVEAPDTASSQGRRSSTHGKASKASVLKPLLPSRDEMKIITSHARPWLHLYNVIFPHLSTMRDGPDVMALYDRVQEARPDVFLLANVLLSAAITVQQAPEETSGPSFKGIGDGPTFVKTASDLIERVVLMDDSLAGTLEGIEVGMLFVRLLVLSALHASFTTDSFTVSLLGERSESYG